MTKKVTELTALTGAASGDLLLVVDDPSGAPETKKITVANFLGNCSSNITLSNTSVLSANQATMRTISANTLIIRNLQTPANSGFTATRGTFFFDTDYLYIAVANNTIKRVALSSF